MEKMKARDHRLFRGLFQVLVITSSERTLRNYFYLMAQLLVGPCGQIHFYILIRYFKSTFTSGIIIIIHICKCLGKLVVFL